MRLKQEEVVARLKGYGLKFTSVSVHTEGRYTPEDAIWNYKDALVHIPYIHHLVQNVPVQNHKDSLSSIFVQKIFGLRFPIIVYDYEATQYTQTAITTLFFFVLVIHNVCEEVRPGITRVTTHYNIGATRPFNWFSPLVGWVLKKNYKVLTATDIPLRERRGTLRTWGYDFVISDYLTAEDIRNNNIIYPPNPSAPGAGTLDVGQLKEGERKLWGERSDQFGLQISRRQNQLFIHPRMCGHEGADLDQASCKNDHLQCPWHGRAVKYLAKFDLNSSAMQTQSTACHELSFANGVLTVKASTRPKSQAASV